MAKANSGDERVLWSLDGRLRDEYKGGQSHVKRKIRRELSSEKGEPQHYLEDLREAKVRLESAPLGPPEDVLMLRKQAVSHFYRHQRAVEARRRELLRLSAVMLSIVVPVLAVLLVLTPTLEQACSPPLGKMAPFDKGTIGIFSSTLS